MIYILVLFEDVLFALNSGFELLRSVYELFLELELVIIFGFLADVEGAV